MYGDISCQDESHVSITCSALLVPFKELSALAVSRNDESHSFLQLLVKTYSSCFVEQNWTVLVTFHDLLALWLGTIFKAIYNECVKLNK